MMRQACRQVGMVGAGAAQLEHGPQLVSARGGSLWRGRTLALPCDLDQQQHAHNRALHTATNVATYSTVLLPLYVLLYCKRRVALIRDSLCIANPRAGSRVSQASEICPCLDVCIYESL